MLWLIFVCEIFCVSSSITDEPAIFQKYHKPLSFFRLETEAPERASEQLPFRYVSTAPPIYCGELIFEPKLKFNQQGDFVGREIKASRRPVEFKIFGHVELEFHFDFFVKVERSTGSQTGHCIIGSPTSSFADFNSFGLENVVEPSAGYALPVFGNYLVSSTRAC